MNLHKSNIEIFTDGACINNPGPGGWGVLIREDGEEKELSGNSKETTNNRMELLAVIKGLQSLKTQSKVTIYTDSQYVQKGITEWILNWKKNKWRTSNNKPVKNSDLWKELDNIQKKHLIDWRWVRGHSGHEENERVDKIARTEAERVYRN